MIRERASVLCYTYIACLVNPVKPFGPAPECLKLCERPRSDVTMRALIWMEVILSSCKVCLNKNSTVIKMDRVL